MSTTTVRLTDELKESIRSAAASRGLSAHAFILEAITEKTERSELEQAFHASAAGRLARIAESGQTVSSADMRTYLCDRARGQPVSPPSAHT